MFFSLTLNSKKFVAEDSGIIMQTPVYHISALLAESVDALAVCDSGTYVDVTFGGGGHSREILRRLGAGGRLFAFDQDADAMANIVDDPRFVFVHGNFRFLRNFMRYHGVEKVDGIIADLGVSFYHFDMPERGFSFRFGGRLDMRMNRSAAVSAADILNTYDEERLAGIFRNYGELKNARRMAAAVVARRRSGGIADAGTLVETVSPFISPKQQKKELSQLFQALRIEVNDELGSLRAMLKQGAELLVPGGRFAVLTYHSLEDRLVKNFFRYGNFDGVAEKDFFGRVEAPLRPVNNKVIVPDGEEIERNPRARSAKLRVAGKL